MSEFVFPDCDPVRVQLGDHSIRVVPVVRTVTVSISLGDGCVNDSQEDREVWVAEHLGRMAWGDSPMQAAENVLLPCEHGRIA